MSLTGDKKPRGERDPPGAYQMESNPSTYSQTHRPKRGHDRISCPHPLPRYAAPAWPSSSLPESHASRLRRLHHYHQECAFLALRLSHGARMLFGQHFPSFCLPPLPTPVAHNRCEVTPSPAIGGSSSSNYPTLLLCMPRRRHGGRWRWLLPSGCCSSSRLHLLPLSRFLSASPPRLASLRLRPCLSSPPRITSSGLAWHTPPRQAYPHRFAVEGLTRGQRRR
ncbi:hypothetical protein BDZ97DRAFT_1788839 [Flammula alnicola]|nr:hypothetical protein BDZ97DRAFT_1788839 [Flammula alnicola]